MKTLHPSTKEKGPPGAKAPGGPSTRGTGKKEILGIRRVSSSAPLLILMMRGGISFSLIARLVLTSS